MIVGWEKGIISETITGDDWLKHSPSGLGSCCSVVCGLATIHKAQQDQDQQLDKNYTSAFAS